MPVRARFASPQTGAKKASSAIRPISGKAGATFAGKARGSAERIGQALAQVLAQTLARAAIRVAISGWRWTPSLSQTCFSRLRMVCSDSPASLAKAFTVMPR